MGGTSLLCFADFQGYLIGNALLNLHTYVLPCIAPALDCRFSTSLLLHLPGFVWGSGSVDSFSVPL